MNDGQRPDGRDGDLREEPDEQQGDLHHGQHAEAEAIAGHDLAPRDGRGEQSLQRAADPLAQEADAGQHEDEEVREEGDEGRREQVEDVRIRRAIDD